MHNTNNKMLDHYWSKAFKKILQKMGRSLIHANISQQPVAKFHQNIATKLLSNSQSKNQQKLEQTNLKSLQLPSQPVPSLSSTIMHFLSFNQIFSHNKLKSKEELKRIKETYDNCHDLSTSKQVERLQYLLQERAKVLPNWFTPWWLNVAYLEARTPLPIVTSPGISFPAFKFFAGKNRQIELASKIIQANLLFLQKIVNEELPYDKLGNGEPLDMNQYSNIFGTTRIPKRIRDDIVYGKDRKEWSRHIIVTRNGHSFYFPVRYANGEILSTNDLLLQFDTVIAFSKNKNPFPINYCSTNHRDLWADVYQRVKSNNPRPIEIFESSLFVLGLDNCVVDPRFSNSVNKVRQAMHGGGSSQNTHNRWFDKTLQFFVNELCDVCVTYEHTPAEGPPLNTFLNYVIAEVELDHFEKLNSNNKSSNVNEFVEKLNFNLENTDRQAIELSLNEFDVAVENLEIFPFMFEHFGKNVPKTAKVSPDGFIQIALQLAFYRIHKTHPPTYETATLRRYLDGRTENIRLPNDASIAFVEAASLNAETSNSVQLRKLLIDAIKAHTNYTLQAMHGQGMDRHLLGLKLMALECSEDLPKIFKSEVYNYMMHFRLSTSQVPSTNNMAMGFGPSASDCYGVCYNPLENSISLTITAYNDCLETSCTRFVIELEKALLDLQKIISASNSTNYSKL